MARSSRAGPGRLSSRGVPRAQVQCTRLTPQLLQAVARLPRLADLNMAQFDLAAASRCEGVMNWQLLYTLAAMTALTALDLSHVMIQEPQARPAARG